MLVLFIFYINDFLFTNQFFLANIFLSPLFMHPPFLTSLPILKDFLYPSPYDHFW